MKYPSAVVILNSKSGSRAKSEIPNKLQSMAETLGITCDIVSARTGAEVIKAARQAAQSRYGLVIAGGGDGTINAVASELVGTGKRLGVLPLGTFNYYAREMGVHTDLEAAFRTCFEGETRSVAVGEVNGRVFLNNASIGLYPVIISVREQTYRRWGRNRVLAYSSILTALLRLRLSMTLTVTVNGERRTLRTPLLFVARNAVQLEEFRVPGVRCVGDDGFSVYALRPLGRLGVCRLAWHALIGKLDPQYDFDMVCTTGMRVESSRMLRTVAFDGERTKMLAPLEFRVRQDALCILVPKKHEEVAA
jgi:diacylglycerol kinase family enzyme